MAVPDLAPATSGDDLNDTERALLKAAATGKLIDLTVGDPDVDNPANAANWDGDRSIRANFLADLLTGDRTPSTGRLRSIKLCGARITGLLDLEARKLLCPLLLRACHFDGPIEMEEAEAVSIRLPGCHVPALYAAQIRTVGNVELDEGFTARGEIDFTGAHIGGVFDLGAASLTNDNGPALDATRIIVDQGMYCLEGFTARGGISLLGAHIGGHLILGRATLTNDSDPALDATGITVNQNLGFGEGSSARGEIMLWYAQIGGELDLSEASLATPKASPDNPNRVALNLREASARSLYLPEKRPDGTIDLENAKVGVLYDFPDGWPAGQNLSGFTYDRFGNEGVSSSARLRWLALHRGSFRPQVYDQLADVYRRAGDEGAARKVAIIAQRIRRRIYSPLSWLWYLTVGYGYRTWYAFVWATVLTIIGSRVFNSAYPSHMAALSTHPPRFQPVIYTLDVLLPIGGLGQKSVWQPTTSGLLDWYWSLAIAGWVLSAAVVAGLTGILKRD